MSEYSQFSRNTFRNRSVNPSGNNFSEDYQRLDQSDAERTRDEYLEALEQDKKIKEEYNKSNLFKSRIIDSEINASLILQIILFYHYYYSIMSFFFQFISACYKIYIFKIDNILVTRLILIIFWVAIEFYRIEYGFTANIKESFPNLLFFTISTFVFCFPCQIMQIVGSRVLPFDFAVTILQIIFIFTEILFASRSAAIITRKTGNTFYLRNSFTRIYNKNDNIIKSSNEIEQELFFHFPNLALLKKNYTSNDYNSKHNRDLNFPYKHN